MTANDLLAQVKQNLIITFNDDDSLIVSFISAAISYAEGYQHLDEGYYSTHEMSERTKQAVIMLTSHFYESRDGSTGGFFADNTNASDQTYKAVNRLLMLDREWKVQPMGLGLMNKKAQIISIDRETDSEGFSFESVAVLAEVRVFVEGRHGSERWANLAAFSEATDLFKLRKIPGLTITTKHYLVIDEVRYDILSVENIKGRGMYLEILAKRVEASNG